MIIHELTTEVGYCRAWIRLALNEGLLSSYMLAIRRDNSALKPYYNQVAFMRDTDLVEITQRLVESVDYICFNLASNSSLLNLWSSTPLLMAAIWSPPMKSCPVFSAIDIAKTISCEQPNDNLENSEIANSILSSFNLTQNNFSGVSEDETFKIILARRVAPVQQPLLARTSLKPLPIGEKECGRFVDGKFTVEAETAEEPLNHDTAIHGKAVESADKAETTDTRTVENILFKKQSWSAAINDNETSLVLSTVSRTSQTIDGPQSLSEGPTYNALLKSYQTAEYRSPNFKELLENYPLCEPVVAVMADPMMTEPYERQNFDEQLGQLAREKGLDLQNYNCLDCGQQIGLTFAKANVCNFSGDYFCCNCMADQEHLVPARVIHNWDLKRYQVSLKASQYLDKCSTLLDFKILNPRIYSAVDLMAQLQTLRVQLNLLRAYLFTCREPTIESFYKMIAPRNYLYEHVHQYTVFDLLDIPSGTLAQQLQKVVEFARNHIIGCWLCSQKGFICEICNNPKVIYPFDTQSTYQCGSCNAVYHTNCQNASQSCQKCERIQKRMDLS
ncbi:uncharacterized protein LOC106639575 isoform X2 [Copidosoma floridanum]|uniref:uncharacterized protein LOC106639575 isoform X2 n=1 Tax=Copidosoma floridanum TaxID=29053 RepID=UPI0006C9CFA5|nr:uncharacterized protein LOC106639575 isoform X2 [Copidosoma floridanum]